MLALSSADTNIHYLGPSGLKTVQGLNVAYLDGMYGEATYRSDPKDMDSTAGCRHYTEVTRSYLLLSALAVLTSGVVVRQLQGLKAFKPCAAMT